MVQIIEDEFGRTKQPSTSETEIVKRFTFRNRNGVTVQVRSKYIIKLPGTDTVPLIL